MACKLCPHRPHPTWLSQCERRKLVSDGSYGIGFLSSFEVLTDMRLIGGALEFWRAIDAGAGGDIVEGTFFFAMELASATQVSVWN